MSLTNFQQQQAQKILSMYNNVVGNILEKSEDNDELEKAQSVGYINAHGKQKQADGTWKYVGKAKKEDQKELVKKEKPSNESQGKESVKKESPSTKSQSKEEIIKNLNSLANKDQLRGIKIKGTLYGQPGRYVNLKKNPYTNEITGTFRYDAKTASGMSQSSDGIVLAHEGIKFTESI